jgi:hypothetical protein
LPAATAGVQPSVDPPDAIEEGLLKSQATRLEGQLAADPNNVEALEALAVTKVGSGEAARGPGHCANPVAPELAQPVLPR